MAFSKCGAFTVGKGWRRTIGVKVGDGGKLMPCRFWLGMDKPRATATALQIESLWVGLDAPYWTPEAWSMAEAIRVGATAKDAPELKPRATAAKATASVLTVMALIERYRTAYAADPRLSAASKNAMACRSKSLERSPIASMPLETIGAEQLAQLISYWLARPNNLKGEPISNFSARIIVKTARSVFDWADAVGLWVAPRRFDRLFRLPRTSSQPIIETYSMDELTKLYGRANGRMRLFILLSLNCGFCSAELATLKRAEIDLQAKVIKRARQKTMIPMSWKLWGETATALSKGMASEGDLALTDDGKPLVSFIANAVHRHDVLPNRWARLKKLAKVEHGSFKTLRKTGATMIRAIGGIEVSEMYLAHSEKSMARFYSKPNHDELSTALDAMRKQLAPMFKGAKGASQGG